MRFVFATVLIAHGVAHVVGFLGAWAPTRTTIVGNRLDLGTGWIKLVGLLWLAAAMCFGFAGVAAAVGATWWPTVAAAFAASSLILCLLQLPQTMFGVGLNLTLLILLSAGRHAGWF